MPQKWQCRCGNGIPVTQVYCGYCGTKWTKAHRQDKPASKAKAQPAAQPTGPPGLIQEFQLPAVGLQLSQSSQSAASSGVPTSDKQPALKSIKTQLHQRANRIGKVEQRIEKLQAGIQEVSQSWPAHVQELSQTLQSDFQRCKEFQDRATQELPNLQTDLQGLLTQRLDQEIPVSMPTQPILPVSEHHGEQNMNSLMPQVYAAISQLQAQGFIQVNMPLPEQSPMDCTELPKPRVHTPVGSFLSQAPSAVYSQVPVVQPSMHPTVGPQPCQVFPAHFPVQPSQVNPAANGFFQHAHVMPMPAPTLPFAHVPVQVQPADAGHTMMQATASPVPQRPMSPPPGDWNSPSQKNHGHSSLPAQSASQTEALPVQEQMYPNPLYKPAKPAAPARKNRQWQVWSKP